MTRQRYLFSGYHYIIYLKGYFIALAKVTGVVNKGANSYLFPNTNLTGNYGEVSNSKNSGSGTSQNGKSSEVSYLGRWCGRWRNISWPDSSRKQD
ncbi:hypothetical protein ES703_125261 [subsurface metagenome]